MKVKTFHALTMREAIRAIKEELGPDAIILSSKEVYEGDRKGHRSNRPLLEVVAACEEQAPYSEKKTTAGVRAASGATGVRPPSPPSFHATLQSMVGPAVGRAERGVGSPLASLTTPEQEGGRRERFRRLRAELYEVSRLLGKALPPETQSVGKGLPPALARMCHSFIRQGMHPSSAEALGIDLQQTLGKEVSLDEGTLTAILQKEIGRRIRVDGRLLSESGGRTIGLILGPSGAGKTSVVTKLAAYYRLEQHRSVAVVTCDAYREVSVEHLRRYARTLGVPFASAQSPRQLYEGLRRYTRVELVLIDMPGVRPDDVSSAQELHRYLKGEADVITHVVLPASAAERELRSIIDRVESLPSLRLLFTKLDEAESFGTIYDVAHNTGVPLSYWGIGQRVPEDIEVASAGRLAEFLMAQRYVAVRCPSPLAPMASGRIQTPLAVGAIAE